MKLVILVCMLVPALALAQPGSASTGSGGSAPAAGSGSAPAAGSGSAPAPAPESPPAPPPSEPNAAARKACTDAMNADPMFEKAIVETADRKAAEARLEADRMQHEIAAAQIAKNEKHVILAYAAMWIIAAAFVFFLWRRQQMLRGEITQLKADLAAATKDGK